MINAVSSTPSNNTQPQSSVGAGPMPVSPMMPAASTVVEHPITGMPTAPVPVTTTTTTTTTATPLSPAGAPFPARPDLRENKTSLDLEKTTVDSFSTGAGNGMPAGQAPKKKKNFAMIAGVVAFLILLVGGGVGLYLSQQNADLRQQASVGTYGPACGAACTGNLDCPSGNSCSAGKCALTTCLAAGADCAADKCSVTPVSGAACSVSFNVTSNNSISCQKVAYQDELSNSAGNYSTSTQRSEFAPGDVIVFKVTSINNGQESTTISLNDALSDSGSNNLGKVTFMDSDCGEGAYNSGSNTLTCPADSVAVGASVAHTFRVKLDGSIADGTNITNTGAVVGGNNTNSTCSVTVSISGPDVTPSPTPSPSPSPSPTETTYSCNSICSTDAQCQAANGNYICSSNQCRLNNNTNSETCSPPTTTSYVCNSDCTTDAQCQTYNASYVCDSTHGNKCRLDSNRDSDVCTVPANTYACNSSCSTDAQCQTASGNYVCSNNECRLNSNVTATNCQPTIPVVVTPAIGCNETCVTNADCSANNQICATTDSGLKCRLDNYVNSETCTTPGTTSVTYTPGVTPTPVLAEGQPEKPTTLPKTGSTETTVRFLIMGAGAVVLGALGLLFL